MPIELEPTAAILTEFQGSITLTSVQELIS